MVSWLSVKQIEHFGYPYEDAIASADTINGAFGEVTDGEFAVAANASKAIMQVEYGDEMYLDKYNITAGEHVRVVDFTDYDGQSIQIYGAQVPNGVAVGDKLASDETGTLVTGASAAPYFEVTKIIGNYTGVEATIVMTDGE